MNATFPCPKCKEASRAEIAAGDTEFACSHCHQTVSIPRGAYTGGELKRCLACPSTDLFVRKDFPQRLGVQLVVVGIVASCIAWYYTLVYVTFAILFVTALIDIVLYLVVPDALMCYRCGSMYRGVAAMDQHGAFNLETHERHRQHVARLAEHGAANIAAARPASVGADETTATK